MACSPGRTCEAGSVNMERTDGRGFPTAFARFPSAIVLVAIVEPLSEIFLSWGNINQVNK